MSTSDSPEGPGAPQAGAPQPIHVAFVWHMHQPYYRSAQSGAFQMPWARLHALKDYYGMVAVMRDFPSVHATFNMVPSLVWQIEDYARDTARESAYEVAFKPVDFPEFLKLMDALGYYWLVWNQYPF